MPKGTMHDGPVRQGILRKEGGGVMREQYGTMVFGIGYCAAELDRCIRSLHAKFLRRLLQRRAFR